VGGRAAGGDRRAASNEEGLAFAIAQGFVEIERYLLPGATVPYVALVLG
jgi:hypothetical protein